MIMYRNSQKLRTFSANISMSEKQTFFYFLMFVMIMQSLSDAVKQVALTLQCGQKGEKFPIISKIIIVLTINIIIILMILLMILIIP